MGADATGQPAEGTAAERDGAGVRFALEWTRGWFLVVAVAVGAVLTPRPALLEPAVWRGFTPQDLIFPVFVALGGVGLALAYQVDVPWSTTIRRSAVLLAAGLAFNMVAAVGPDLDNLRWTGELQVCAVLVLVTGLLHKVVRGPAGWTVVTALVATAQALLLCLWELGCPDGVLTPRCNPSLTIDGAVLGGEHLYLGGALGHDPEGLVVTVGALVTVAAGITAGHLALRAGAGPRPAAYLLALAGALTLAALASAQPVPTIGRLWSTPMALGAGGLAAALVAGARALLAALAPKETTSGRRSALTWPVVALGRNFLLVYFGSQLLMVLLTRGNPGLAYWIGEWVEPYALGHNRAAVVAVILPLWVAVASLLHWRRVYLRP